MLEPVQASGTEVHSDVAAMRARGVPLQTVDYDAPHEWTPAVSRAIGAWLDR